MGTIFRRAASALILAAIGVTASAGEGGMVTVAGEVYYRQRIALSPTAQLYVAVEDVSLMDVPAVVMAEKRISPAGQVPIAFELRVDAARIEPGHTYAIRARIEEGGRLLWINTEHIPVRLDGADNLRVRVDQVSGSPGSTLIGTSWLADDIGGRGVVDRVQSTLAFTEPGRVGGLGGCNRYFGPVTLKGDSITFGNLASTRMMCPDALMDQEQRLFQALSRAKRFELSHEGQILRMYAEDGTPVLRFSRIVEN